MRQTHTPGERLFIDYASQTIYITDVATGAIGAAQIFAAVLGASNYRLMLTEPWKLAQSKPD